MNNQHLRVKNDLIMKEGPKDMVIKKLILTFTHGLVKCGRFHKGKHVCLMNDSHKVNN
jgi:hypothetical protein